MDPQACLARLVDAIADEDRGEAAEAADDLYTWLCDGGFAPEIDRASLTALVLGVAIGGAS